MLSCEPDEITLDCQPPTLIHNDSIPWVEKYRPSQFNDIVLDSLNKQILTNVIESGYFPNFLFYGPPGTGKTTTVVNLVNSYQIKMNQPYKKLIIHLNASDERGIDIIRNQINQFVNSKTMFNQGMKFIILDEVDYMTKNAQQALRYLLQTYNANVRFCLICNYISRIDDGLQNVFLRLRFNQLPKKDVVRFLTKISDSEKLNLSKASIDMIQLLYNSDIRSMINCMQSNQNLAGTEFAIINDSVWEYFYTQFARKESNVEKLSKILQTISHDYSIDKKNIIKDFLNYIIRNKKHIISIEFLNFVENLMHNQECKTTHYVSYSLFRIKSFVCKENPH
jgi:DNA polymerase III delta prime subunit